MPLPPPTIERAPRPRGAYGAQRTMRSNLTLLVLLAVAAGCAQARHGGVPFASSELPRFAVGPQGDQAPRPRERRRGTPYGATRARLQFFREQFEFDELDVDFDGAPDADLSDPERERIGFRAEFGSNAIGGFFQVFGEEFRAPALLGEDFDMFGFGGGISGAPDVGHAGPVEFVVPVRFAINVAGGSETVNGFDADLGYLESVFEVGFGGRAFGAQLSSGLVVDSIGALYESDDPSSFANDDPAVITGTNVGVYFEGLYKHDRVPLMARARVVLGDVQGFLLSFGFAF